MPFEAGLEVALKDTLLAVVPWVIVLFAGVVLQLGLDVATDTVIFIVAEIDLVVSTLSVAVIVILLNDVCDPEYVPDNTPFIELRVRPVGKLVEE